MTTTPLLPLYAVPGLMNDERVWQHQVKAFSSSGREVRVAPSATHDTVQALAAAVLANAPAPRFALAGFSLGGYVALEMMRQAPGRVAALALVDTGARADTPEATEMRGRMLAAVGDEPASFEEIAAAYLPRVVHPARAGDTQLTQLMIAMALAVGAAGFVRQQHVAIGRPDSRPTLADIRCPTLVLCGRQDQVTPLERSEEMATLIPGARLVVIEDCGHMSLLERPPEATQALAEWLQDAGSRQRIHPAQRPSSFM